MTDEEATVEVWDILVAFDSARVQRSDLLREFKRRNPETRSAVWAARYDDPSQVVSIGTSAKKYVSKALRSLEQDGTLQRYEGYVVISR